MKNKPNPYPIGDYLSGPALLLWEIATAYRLEPEDVAPYVDAPVGSVYAWFGGKQIPTEDEKKKIIAAVRQIDKDHRFVVQLYWGIGYPVPPNDIWELEPFFCRRSKRTCRNSFIAINGRPPSARMGEKIVRIEIRIIGPEKKP